MPADSASVASKIDDSPSLHDAELTAVKVATDGAKFRVRLDNLPIDFDSAISMVVRLAARVDTAVNLDAKVGVRVYVNNQPLAEQLSAALSGGFQLQSLTNAAWIASGFQSVIELELSASLTNTTPSYTVVPLADTAPNAANPIPSLASHALNVSTDNGDSEYLEFGLTEEEFFSLDLSGISAGVAISDIFVKANARDPTVSGDVCEIGFRRNGTTTYWRATLLFDFSGYNDVSMTPFESAPESTDPEDGQPWTKAKLSTTDINVRWPTITGTPEPRVTYLAMRVNTSIANLFAWVTALELVLTYNVRPGVFVPLVDPAPFYTVIPDPPVVG